MVKFEKHRPSEEELKKLGVDNWGVWTKEISEFPWEYGEMETFYVLEGNAKVTSGDESIEFGPGDLVTCHSGVECKWKISNPIKKRYHFGPLN